MIALGRIDFYKAQI